MLVIVFGVFGDFLEKIWGQGLVAGISDRQDNFALKKRCLFVVFLVFGDYMLLDSTGARQGPRAPETKKTKRVCNGCTKTSYTPAGATLKYGCLNYFNKISYGKYLCFILIINVLLW